MDETKNGVRCEHWSCVGEEREYEFGIELFLHKAMHAADDDKCCISVSTDTGSYKGEFGPGDVEEFLAARRKPGPATQHVIDRLKAACEGRGDNVKVVMHPIGPGVGFLSAGEVRAFIREQEGE